MKKIFIYGDSNTWGYVPTLKPYDGNDDNTMRYDEKDTWWYALTNDNVVYVNGCNGRTINNDHMDLPNRNSMKTINRDLVNDDIALTIIMLGTNDLKDCYNLSVDDLINNMDKFLSIIKNRYQTEVMLICPPLIYDTVVTHEKYTDGINKVKEYEIKLKKYCLDNNYMFVSGINCEVGIDGEHLTKAGHKLLDEEVLKCLGTYCS